MRTADARWLLLGLALGCSTPAVAGADGGTDASSDAARCSSLGLSCGSPDASCPSGTGIYGLPGRPSCGPGAGCCEPCAAPNQVEGNLCITAGQTQCLQRGGVCADTRDVCPAGYDKGSAPCGDGVVMPFASCCLPASD